MTDRRLAVAAWESLFRAQHEVFADVSRDFASADVEQDEYDVLLTVVRSAGMTARLRDVTASMLISQPSVSRLVDRMVARGLVIKCADPADRRGALVIATDAGARAYRAFAVRHARSIAARMRALDDGELRTLIALTSKLRDQQA
jgi:DNA-binding MarR family transcriptional regulator